MFPDSVLVAGILILGLMLVVGLRNPRRRHELPGEPPSPAPVPRRLARPAVSPLSSPSPELLSFARRAGQPVRSGVEGAATPSPYRLVEGVLSRGEKVFGDALAQAVRGMAVVLPKVRVADVVQPVEGLGDAARWDALKPIVNRHFDFLVAYEDFQPVLAVELDDRSHDSPKAAERDRSLNEICKAAGLPMLRVRATAQYDPAVLRSQIWDVLGAPLKAQAVIDPSWLAPAGASEETRQVLH